MHQPTDRDDARPCHHLDRQNGHDLIALALREPASWLAFGIMFDRGYWRIGSLWHAPVRLHWTIPVGCLMFSSFNFVPATWVIFALLVLAHEVGHAIWVRRFNHRVVSIDVTGLGGMCRWAGHASGFESAVIAWGGILVQLAILLLTMVGVALVGSPTNPIAAQIVYALTSSNIWLIVINLMPMPPLDGAKAWTLFGEPSVHRWFASLPRHLSKLLSRSRPKTKRSISQPGRVIDFEQERRKRNDRVDDGPVRSTKETRLPSEVADELIRLAEEAARARRKRDEN